MNVMLDVKNNSLCVLLKKVEFLKMTNVRVQAGTSSKSIPRTQVIRMNDLPEELDNFTLCTRNELIQSIHCLQHADAIPLVNHQRDQQEGVRQLMDIKLDNRGAYPPKNIGRIKAYSLKFSRKITALMFFASWPLVFLINRAWWWTIPVSAVAGEITQYVKKRYVQTCHRAFNKSLEKAAEQQKQDQPNTANSQRQPLVKVIETLDIHKDVQLLNSQLRSKFDHEGYWRSVSLFDHDTSNTAKEYSCSKVASFAGLVLPGEKSGKQHLTIALMAATNHPIAKVFLYQDLAACMAESVKSLDDFIEDPDQVMQALANGFKLDWWREAHQTYRQLGSSKPLFGQEDSIVGMATALTAYRDNLYLTHAGTCRALLCHADSTVQRLTVKPDSQQPGALAGELIFNPPPSAENNDQIQTALLPRSQLAEARLVLMSPNVAQVLSDDQEISNWVQKTINHENLEPLVDDLVRVAHLRGARGDLSVMVIEADKLFDMTPVR